MRCRPQHAESSFNDMNNLITFLTRTNSITKDTSVTSTEKIEAIQALMADRGLWTTISNSAEISKLSVLTAIEQLLEQEEHSVVYETTLHKFDESTKAKIEEIGNKIKQLKIGTSKDLFRTRSSPSGK
jgi:BioD-like phosphotransacetylase family protein